jgi:hypothetical protein
VRSERREVRSKLNSGAGWWWQEFASRSDVAKAMSDKLAFGVWRLAPHSRSGACRSSHGARSDSWSDW